MKANTLCLMLAALLSGGAYAQAIMEHAAGAAGATVGTAGGKALSSVLDKALSKAAGTGTQASTEKKPGTKPSPLPAATSTAATSSAATSSAAPSPVKVGGPLPGASSTKTAGRIARAARPPAPLPDKPIFVAPDRSMPAPAAALAPPPLSEQDFAKVKEGSARQDVFATLGTPSSRITIPDDGHLIEILSYSDGAHRLGSIRIDNGQVVTVTPAAR